MLSGMHTHPTDLSSLLRKQSGTSTAGHPPARTRLASLSVAAVVFVACLLNVGLCQGGEVSQAALTHSNLLQNGDFEAGMAGWFWQDGWKGAVEPGGLRTGNAFVGRHAYEIHVPGDMRPRHLYLRAFEATPGVDYVLSIALACEAMPDGSAVVRLLQWHRDADGILRERGYVTVNGSDRLLQTGGTHDWKRMEVRIPRDTIAADTERISLYIFNQAPGVGKLRIDAASVTISGKAVPRRVADTSAPPIPKAPDPSDKQPQILSPMNLHDGDTSFETTLSGWSIRNGSGWLDERQSTHGASSLRFETDARGRGRIMGPRQYGKIKRGRSYTFSFDARADADTTLRLSLWNAERWTPLAEGVFRLSPEWDRFVLSVPPQSTDVQYYVEIGMKDAPPVNLDAFQLDEGEATAYQPARSVFVGLAALAAPANLHVTGSGPLAVNVRVFRAEEGVSPLFLSLSTEDIDGQRIWETERPLPPGSSGAWSERVEPIPMAGVGYYRITATLRNADGSDVASAELPIGIIDPRGSDTDGMSSFFGMHGRLSLGLDRIGVRWLTYFLFWNAVEPRPGVFTVDADTFREPREAGYHLFYSLCPMRAPSWARAEDGRLRDADDYRRFIRHMVELAGDHVRHWEIEGEPDLVYPRYMKASNDEAADYYARIVREAAAEIRDRSPEAQVLACGVSGAGHGMAFARRTLEHVGAFVDIMTPHPYANARQIGDHGAAISPEQNDLRNKLLSWVALSEEHGGGRPLWIGELGWAVDVNADILGVHVLNHARYLVRSHLIAKSVPGFERVFWFSSTGVTENRIYEYGLWRNEQTPLPATVAYAAMTRVLDGTRPVETLFDSAIQLHLFAGEDGQPMAALWKTEGEAREMTANLPPASLSALDMWGRPVTLHAREGRVVLPLDESPLYLFGNNMTVETMLERLREADVAVEPVTLSATFGSIDAISGFIRNNLPTPQRGTLRCVAPAGFRTDPEQVDILLSPGGAQAFQFVLAGEHPPSGGDGIRLVYESAGKTVSRKLPLAFEGIPRFTPAVSDDQKTFTLDGMAVFTLRERGDILPPDPHIAWDGPEDLSVQAGISWDESYFHLAAIVTDDIHHQQDVGHMAWRGDCMQLAFDTMNDASEHRMEYDGNDYEYLLALTSDGPKVFRHHAPEGVPAGGKEVTGKVRCVIVREEGRTLYRAAFPWSALAPLSPMPGRIFRFNFIVMDNDGTGGRYWMGLTPGIGEMKYPFLFRTFVIEGP